MLKKILKNKVIWLGLFLLSFLLSVNSSQAAPSLGSRLSGYILLQVESLGEAWYVIPKEQQRVYMKDGAVAYQIMREVSLGITNANLAKIPVGIEARFNDVDTDSDGLSDNLEKGLDTDPNKADTDNDGFPDGEEIKNNYSPLGPNKLSYDNTLVNRLKGYILLQVEKQGQAWYLNPKDGKRYYMQDGPAAYNIMRYLSLGITNKNLDLVPKSSRVFKVDTSNNSSNQGNQNNQGNQGNNNNSTSTPPGNSGNQGGNSGGGGGGGGGGNRPPTPSNDQDNDGYVTVASGGNDCNDSNPSIHPGATDICGNNVDEDCSGADLQCVAPDYDQDNDGYDATQYGGTDCNDNNSAINPGATEVPGNNIDDNCNAQTDENNTPVTDNIAPSIPTNLSGTTSGTQVVLSWSPSTDNVGVYLYDIERQISIITGWQSIASVNATTYTNIDLVYSGTYKYRIKARDAAGNSSAYSSTVTITTNAAPDTTSPTTPTNLTASASGTQISLTWSASTDNIGVYQYHLERSTDNATFQEITTSVITSYTDSNLLNGTTYYYRVRARDAALNYSLFSNTANASTVAIINPPSSINISGVSGTLSQGQTVTISGSGFGSKNRQQPLMFDNLVQTAGYQGYLQNNTIVPTRGCAFGGTTCEANPQSTNQSLPWYNHWYGGTPRFYIGPSSRYTGHPAYRATNLADDFSRKGFFARDFAVNTAEGWTNLDWWIRSNAEFGQGPGGGVSGKILRLWHHPDLVDQLVLVNMPGPQMYADRGCTVHTSNHIEYISAYPLNQWIHLSVMTKVAASGTEAHVLVNGELVATVTGFCGNDGIYDYLRMVGLDPSIPEYLDPNLEFLWGDIYFDDSLARVVLSNSSTFNPLGGSSTNHYEMQNVQSWSNGSISIKVNPGSFSSGQTAYLYVVDSNGNVNSSGYPVVISSNVTPDTTAPSTPSNLSASASGTSISLTWSASSDNVGVSQYLIERSTSASSGFTQIATSNTTSYSDSGLSNSTTYYYRVRAQDTSGNNSSYSSNASATTGAPASDTTAPSTPSNLSASASGTSISLTWSAATDNVGVARYLVERSTSASSGFTQIATSNTTSYSDSGLANSTTYYYRVRAQDNANNTSSYSSTANATTAAASVSTTNLIQNSWDFSSTAWDGDALGANPWSPKSNFTFTSGQSDPFGTTKAFRIALSTSNRPYQQRDSTPNLTLNHDAVTASLYVKYGNSANIIFGLNDATTNTEYEQTFNFNSGVPVYNSGTNDGTTVTNVGNGWYRISMRLNLLSRGIKGHSFKGRVTPAGSASASGTYSYVTGFQLESGTQANTYIETPSGSADTQNPSTPTNLSASVSGTTSSLSWSASTDNVGVTGYQILRSTTNGSGYSQIATSNITSYSDSGLSAGSYYYVVKAYDATGNTSANSNQATATIASQSDTTAPSAPNILSIYASGTSISLTWSAATDNVGVARYLVERSTSASSGFTQIATPTNNSYTDSGLANSTTYYYRVRAQDNANNTSSYSSTANATTGSTTPPPSGSVTISGVSGTLSQGQTVTISGSGFGTKSTVSPLVYDTMESGSFSSAWQSYNQLTIGSDAANRRNANSTYYGTNNFQNNLFRGAGFFTGSNSELRDTWYARYWFKLDNNWDWGTTGYPDLTDASLANVKFFRLWNPGDTPEDFVMATQGYSGGGFIHEGSNIPGSVGYFGNQNDWTKGTWHVLDFAFKENSSLGAADGVIKMWSDGKKILDKSNVVTRYTFSGFKRPLILGFYNSWWDSGSNSDRDDFYIDDAYLDGTWSRVMLCNQSTWNDSVSRNCEIQAPQSTWTNNSLQISFNAGSFTSGQTVYLYVVDSNGNVNSSGYPITISGVLGANVSSCNNPDQDTINWTQIPNGTLVRGCGSAIYVIQNNKRVYINSLEVLKNQYPGQRIYNVNNDLLLSYPLAT